MALDLDPGRAAAGNPQLVNAIIAEMDGFAIPFDRFMELALYHPEFGYYRTPGRIGPQGDFLTSPTIHPMFGWAVAGWCREVWQRCGSPADFVIFEPAAGEGALATAVLDWADGRDAVFRSAIRYVALEPNAAGNDPRIEWATPPVEPASAGIVLSNELFDALPVRLFEAGGRGPIEMGVRWDGEAFRETAMGVAKIDDAPPSGRFEVTPGAYPLMRSLCGLIERGAVLTFDYGYPQEELWAPWRTQGTLLSFYRHTAHDDPLLHVGEQDITAHVNLSELLAAMRDSGMETAGPVSQSAFLLSLGLGALVESERADMNSYFARRRAFQTLTDSGGLGRVRVIAGSRKIEGPLPGFEEES